MGKPICPTFDTSLSADDKIKILAEYVEILRREYEFRLGLLQADRPEREDPEE